MNNRERTIRAIQFQPVDSLPFRHAYGVMPGVLEAWYAEGLPASVKSKEDQYAYFGFPPKGNSLPLNLFLDPPFVSRVLEDTGEYVVSLDSMNRKVRMYKQYASIPLALDFPVKDHATWQEYKRRLRFHPGRVGADLEKAAALNVSQGCLNSISVMGFYWLPRDLMGDEALCVAYYEMPDLVKDMLETWCGLLEAGIEAALRRVRVDSIHLGEDMAYKNASIVGKPIFDEFIAPYYRRIRRLVDRYEVPIFSVDSDGCLHELAGWFREVGVNLIGPNEAQAGNDIREYRRWFGKTMAYDGGLEKQTLTKGRDAIDAMLEGVIPFMKETGGGWIISLDHRVVPGTPLADFQYYIRRVRELAKF